MQESDRHDESCGCGCSRREFLAGGAAAAATMMGLGSLRALSAEEAATPAPAKQPADIRVVFIYPPSEKLAQTPDAWWSWPGNDFDAEGRQKLYCQALAEIEKRLPLKLTIEPGALCEAAAIKAKAQEIVEAKADGLLVVLMHNSIKLADILVEAAEKAGIPVVFYVPLGTVHGSITRYRRPGLYFIQSLENLEAIEYGLRMIAARKRMAQSLLLSIVEAPAVREGKEAFLGTTVRVIPFQTYAQEFDKVTIDDKARELIARFTGKATEQRNVTKEALENAARAHLALKKLLADNNADGLTMNCLRRGMLKPCMSFATLNGELIPAACENDFAALYGLMIGQALTGRAGFQHNPCYDTERNHFYGSHCTCSPKLYGPDAPELPYLLRRFAHTNEGSCAIQVFMKEGDPVTVLHYYAGRPAALDVYAGKVVKSHPMPPAGGCTTNVEFALTDRLDACSVVGHHNVLFVGDFARKFRLFANLFKMKVADTGYVAPRA